MEIGSCSDENILSWVSDKDRPRLQDFVELAVNSKERTTATFTVKLGNKQVRSIQLCAKRIDADEKDSIIECLFIPTFDSLTDAEKLGFELSRLIQNARSALFGMNLDGRINLWNKTMVRITEIPAKEALGTRRIAQFVAAPDRRVVSTAFSEALRGGEASGLEFTIITKTNSSVRVLINITTRRDLDGNITGALAMGQDITRIDQNRKYSEAMAQELQSLIDTAYAPIFAIDTQGLITIWNDATQRITGYEKAQVLGLSLVEEFIPEEFQQHVGSILQDALVGSETASFEFPIKTKDRGEILLLLNASTRRNTAGVITGVIGVGQDITQIDESRKTVELLIQNRNEEIKTAMEGMLEPGIEENCHSRNRRSPRTT